jgi:predicted ATPase
MALHSDYEIRWKNYRAFEDTGWIRIRPLTVLIGANNSGKTSILSPMLLLNQTILSSDAVTPLVTRGPLVDAGSFKNIVHNHDSSKQLFLGLRYHLHEEKGKIGKIGTYPPGGVELTMVQGEHSEDVVMKRFALFDVLRRPFLEESRGTKGTYNLKGDAFKLLNQRERDVIKQSRPINFLFSSEIAFRRLQSQGKTGGERVSPVQPSRGFVMYAAALSATLDELRDLFLNLSYVGPLREGLRRYYPLGGEMLTSVGSRGEHMANLVRRQLPQLRDRLNHWIRRFDFGTGLVAESLSDEFFSLSFVDSDRSGSTNIAEAGFGASQVLPLIVQALAARKQSLTIAEQPEIHLNPKLQYVLADLFVEMANSDHRVIVETHSEHLLLRLRRLVADGKIDHKLVAIYFVEKTDGVSSIKHVALEGNGHIPSNAWPKGFFEDSLKESFALAAAQSRKPGSNRATVKARTRGPKGRK